MLKRMGAGAAVYTEGWIVVRDSASFQDAFLRLGKAITHVSFDYDMDQAKGSDNGAQCAAWMKNACKVLSYPIPKILIHSTNQAGIKAIKKVFA